MADVLMLPMPSSGSSVSAQVLNAEHYEALDIALTRLLATRIARESLSQLMDGIPTWSIFDQGSALINFVNSPIQDHTKLCDGAEGMADAFINAFHTSTIEFDSSLLQAFQDTAPESDDFRIRLLELVARSLHCIGVSIHQHTAKAHKGDIAAVVSYQDISEKEDGFTPIIFPPRPSIFYHVAYCDSEQYPFGAADVTGYWLEDRVFGGVVLFDRGDSGKQAKSVWFHSCRRNWTYRVWKLLDWQLDAIYDFFRNGPDHTDPFLDILPDCDSPDIAIHEPSPLRRLKFPFFCDIDNPCRHDDWDAMALHRIYRDPWERSLPDKKPERCVRNAFDYPEAAMMVSQVMDALESTPKYNALAPSPLPALDKPYEELTREERNARTDAAMHFRIERRRG